MLLCMPVFMRMWYVHVCVYDKCMCMCMRACVYLYVRVRVGMYMYVCVRACLCSCLCVPSVCARVSEKRPRHD